jgi:uncharacterized protein DUF4331
MRRILLAAAFVLSACNGGSNPNPGPTPTTNPLGNPPYKQLDRLNRPAVNELYATFAQHQANNADMPGDDATVIKPQIISFTIGVAGRSSAIAGVLGSVLTPDVQIADLSGTSQSCIGAAPGTCNNYLGIETGGATQLPGGLKPFGGRALTDDVVSIALGATFGGTIPALGLAADDGKEQDGRADASFASGHRPNLTTDNVTWQTAPKHFSTTFPYLGPPQ